MKHIWKWIKAEFRRNWVSLIGFLCSLTFYIYSYFHPRIIIVPAQSVLGESADFFISLSTLFMILMLIFISIYLYRKQNE